jgi:hypothetical protein
MTVRSRRTPPESLEPAASINLDTFQVLPPIRPRYDFSQHNSVERIQRIAKALQLVEE